MNKITVSHLSKKYKDKVVLNDVSLEIGNGVFGLFGTNGAGKSTLIRILAGILEHSSGDAFVNDIDIRNKDAVRRITGYLPQDFVFYSHFTSYEVLEYCAALSGMKNSEIHDRVEEVLNEINLTEKRKSRFSKLSGGMKRRLGFGQTILHNPDILIFDEPFNGIDSVEKSRLCKLIEKLRDDKIIIISTHVVSDVENLCNDIGILHNGDLVFKGEISELKESAKKDSLEEAYLNIVHGDVL